jgi:alanyl-tRNA synthetase
MCSICGIFGGDNSAIKEMNTSLGGRGGGKPNFAQGSVSADAAVIRAFFQT